MTTGRPEAGTDVAMTREAALLAVRELLHGDEAQACMAAELRYAIDTAICRYGHAAASEVLWSAYPHLYPAEPQP
jgi:hypothetical protein